MIKCPHCGHQWLEHRKHLDVPTMCRQYREGATIRELAAEYHISYDTAHRRLVEGGEPLRPRGKRKGKVDGTTA